MVEGSMVRRIELQREIKKGEVPRKSANKKSSRSTERIIVSF